MAGIGKLVPGRRGSAPGASSRTARVKGGGGICHVRGRRFRASERPGEVGGLRFEPKSRISVGLWLRRRPAKRFPPLTLLRHGGCSIAVVGNQQSGHSNQRRPTLRSPRLQNRLHLVDLGIDLRSVLRPLQQLVRLNADSVDRQLGQSSGTASGAPDLALSGR
jgi:hypothetical protein